MSNFNLQESLLITFLVLLPFIPLFFYLLKKRSVQNFKTTMMSKGVKADFVILSQSFTHTSTHGMTPMIKIRYEVAGKTIENEVFYNIDYEVAPDLKGVLYVVPENPYTVYIDSINGRRLPYARLT